MFLVHKRNVTERCFFTKEFIDSYQKFINRPFSLNPVFCKILLELASISNKQSSNFRDFTVFKILAHLCFIFRLQEIQKRSH